MYEISRELLEDKEQKLLTKQDRVRIIESFKRIKDDDRILLLLSHIEGREIVASKKILHTTFFNLKSNFSQHFKNFYFTTNENYPFCKRVDDVFFRLQNCRALSMKNPTYESYLINDEVKQMIKEEIQPNIEEEDSSFIEDLEDMVQIVKDFLEHHE